MPEAVGRVLKSVNNGPVVYTYEVDGRLKNVITNVATLNSALNGLRDLIGAEAWASQIFVIELKVVSGE
jgi:hypothetical protein